MADRTKTKGRTAAAAPDAPTRRREGQPPNLLKVGEFSAATGFARVTIYKWAAARRIAVVRIGRNLRIPSDEVDRLTTTGFVPVRPDAA
jgi:excisionase family DNA binding protein